jgi:DinB superfamily
MLTDLQAVVLRDLDTLTREIALYPSDDALWTAVEGLPNSGGTLVLHLVGNLRHFIGAALGRTGYVRDREAEFATRGLSREALAAQVAVARADVVSVLQTLPPSVLDTTFPLQLAGHSFGTRAFLLHLATHLSYHLGQIDYHRRVVSGDRASAGAMPLGPLALHVAGAE